MTLVSDFCVETGKKALIKRARTKGNYLESTEIT